MYVNCRDCDKEAKNSSCEYKYDQKQNHTTSSHVCVRERFEASKPLCKSCFLFVLSLVRGGPAPHRGLCALSPPAIDVLGGTTK